jgi:hypothetical protein
MAFRLADLLRFLHGGEKKKKSLFASEKEAYDFCRNLYRKSGGPTPELLRTYEFYLKNFNDDCPPNPGPRRGEDRAAER